MEDIEREVILFVLEFHQGNRTHASKALGMNVKTFRSKLQKYREEGHVIPTIQYVGTPVRRQN